MRQYLSFCFLKSDICHSTENHDNSQNIDIICITCGIQACANRYNHRPFNASIKCSLFICVYGISFCDKRTYPSLRESVREIKWERDYMSWFSTKTFSLIALLCFINAFLYIYFTSWGDALVFFFHWLPLHHWTELDKLCCISIILVKEWINGKLMHINLNLKFICFLIGKNYRQFQYMQFSWILWLTFDAVRLFISVVLRPLICITINRCCI